MTTFKKKCIAIVLVLMTYPMMILAKDITLYPRENWAVVPAAATGIDQTKIDKLFDLSFQDSATQGVVLIKNGQLIGERYAAGYDENSYGTSWSMAKSFYAALIGISIDRGEINSLDDPVAKYLDYFNDERRHISIRDLLTMTSGLDFPTHEHEEMFFSADHLAYARSVGVEKEAGVVFEYNNVNSMLLSDILRQVTGVAADRLLRDRILSRIGIDNVTLWQDSAGNPLTYCCIDTTARQYSRFGLLFASNGNWDGEQIISKDYVDQTFTKVWQGIKSDSIAQDRGYALHWWISRDDDRSIIFNASGKFGQYIFVDRTNDIIFTRITKYHPPEGSRQDWGALNYVNWIGSIDFRRTIAEFLGSLGLIEVRVQIKSPVTLDDGASKEFFDNYSVIVDALVDIGRPE